MTKIFPLVSLALALASCASGKVVNEHPLSQAELRSLQACDHTTDCVRVNNGCCDCANGGETVSIHRKYEKDFRDLFPCHSNACTQKAGECVFYEPACVKGLCKLLPPKRR